MNRYVRAAVLCLFACVLFGCASDFDRSPRRSDYLREQRWAEQVVPGLVVGEVVPLRTDIPRWEFLAIYTQAKKPRGAVILVHGLGVHPDYGVIGSLRTRLADDGWSTLSIQMPLLSARAPAESYPALFPDAAERISVAVTWLQKKKFRNIVLLSHSMGTRMANYYLGLHPDAPLTAWVALSMPTGEFEPGTPSRVPIFDIYAEKDFPAVLNGVASRAKVLATAPGSEQAMVYGTDHYYNKKENELASLIELMLDDERKHAHK
jgi:predicted alpha/beta-hydrolase family hydrolase